MVSCRPGDLLVETRIATELGTSQAPVREALRDLELLRLVESQPFRSARVRRGHRRRPPRGVPGARGARGARGASRRRSVSAATSRRSRPSSTQCARRRTRVTPSRSFTTISASTGRSWRPPGTSRSCPPGWRSASRCRRRSASSGRTSTGMELVEFHVPILEAVRSGDAVCGRARGSQARAPHRGRRPPPAPRDASAAELSRARSDR